MADGYTARGVVTPEYWIREVASGKRFRKEYADEDLWPTWRKWYRGKFDPRILPANVYFKYMRTLIPRVYYRNPSVSVTASKPGVENMILCKIMEKIDNKLIDVLGVKAQMKRAVQHGAMFGTGGMRLGYGAEFTPTPDALDTADPDTGGVRVQRRVEYNDLVQPNMPWLLAAHPGQVVVPNGAVDIHSARWVCFECFRDVEDVKTDPRFKNADKLLTTTTPTSLAPRSQSTMQPRDREGVVLWEIRDKKTGQVFVMSPHMEGSDKVLYQADDDLQINRRLPYYPLIFNNDDEVFWGIPDSMILHPQQLEKNELREQIRKHRKASIAKWLIESGNMTPDEKSKLVDDNSFGILEAKDISRVKELITSQIPVGLIQAEGLLDNEIQELLGLGVNQFGEYAPGSADRSATEATIVNQATQIRIDERRDACADLMVAMVTDMNCVIIDRWDGTRVEEIAGPAGVPIWVQYTAQDLKTCLYNMKVDPDTSLPLTKALREQKAVQSYGILKTNPFIKPEQLTQFLLSEMYGVDADFLLQQPFMNTSAQQPMPYGQVAQQMGQLPPPRQGPLELPAQVIPPLNIA